MSGLVKRRQVYYYRIRISKNSGMVSQSCENPLPLNPVQQLGYRLKASSSFASDHRQNPNILIAVDFSNGKTCRFR